MSVGYTWVQWSTHKRRYDAIMALAAAAYLIIFIAAGKILWSGVHAISDEVLIIRATGSCAIILLHIILALGPLARLDRRFLPLVYNRRHLGVMTFGIALVHGLIVTGYYHGFGVLNPLVSLLTSNTNFTSVHGFPFELLGVVALFILFMMAATSHDFWLRNMGAVAWKRLHMLVYLAYALLVGHVALGALQTDRGQLAPILVTLGAITIVTLHLVAGRRETQRDRPSATVSNLDGTNADGTITDGTWIDAGLAADIPTDRARTVCAGNERIAVFNHQGKVSAVTNVCAHQGGPLGEGKIIDGCITCPWHGWQYKAHDGCSPPPFTEKITTYQVRLRSGRVEVCTTPLPPGTPTTPAVITGQSIAPEHMHG